MRADPAERLAVVDRLHFFFAELRVATLQRVLLGLERQVGGKVTVADREWMVSRPECDAPFRGDEYESAIMNVIAYRPGRHHQHRAEKDERGTIEQTSAQQPQEC